MTALLGVYNPRFTIEGNKMDKRELLKSMLHNLINDKPEEASLDFHNYLTPKTREVAGLGSTVATPETTDDSGSTDDDAGE